MTIAPVAYSVDVAHKMAGIGRTNFYRLIGEGRIRAVKCGKRTLIRADDLRAFIEGLPVLEPRKGGDQA